MKENSDSLLKKAESFSPIIILINKALENYQKTFSQNISRISEILSSIGNDLQSISTNKINNIKSIIASNKKSFLAYVNDIKISLNQILMKSKEISLEIMSYNKVKSSIDIEILSSEIKQKEEEIINLKKEMNYIKDKYNSVNQSFSDAQKTIIELKEQNFNYKEKMIENEKNFYINSNINKSAGNIGIIEKEKSQISELKNKIKDLNDEIENKKHEYELKLSRMSDKNTNLSSFLNKKNQEFTQLQKENIDKLNENKNLKKQLEKKNLKESEYIEKISEYQKQIEINDKDINNKNSEIISLTDNINNNKILIKSLQTEIEKLKYEKNNNFKENDAYMNILADLENCKKEKEEMENKLELIENDKNEYKKKIDVMESTIYNNNVLINKKDELIEELKIKHQNIKNSILNNNIINNNLNNPNSDLNEKIVDLENKMKEKEEKINELNNIIESYKKDKDEIKDISIIKKNLFQYKNEIESNHSQIKLLKEQIKSFESENKSIKEELQKKNSSDLFEMAEKMLKLEKQLDKYKRNPQKYNLELEKKYEELESKYEKDKQKYLDEIIDLKSQIMQLKKSKEKNDDKNNINNNEPNNNLNSNKKKKAQILVSSSNRNIEEQYNKILEKYINANNEIIKLKKRIEQLEKELARKDMVFQKESLFKFKSINKNDDYEEEIDMVQLKEGVRRKNRSLDLDIDYPGFNENQKKYKELEDRFNKLREQVIPILKENGMNNNKIITKNKVNNICNLLGTSVNTTNNILQNYK